MSVLILSCNTGGGHNACAEALLEQLDHTRQRCVSADCLSFTSQKLSHFVSWGHTTMYRHVPGLFRSGYDFMEKHNRIMEEDSPLHKLLTGGTQPLAELIRKEDVQCIICTHIFAAMLVSQLKKEQPMALQTLFIATDYTCSPGLTGSDLDWYCIPSQATAEEFIAAKIPEEKLCVTGIPVKSDFYRRISRMDARAQLRLEAYRHHLLIMGGSMGCGPVEQLTKLLYEQTDTSCAITVVCGTNQKLLRQLQQRLGQDERLQLLGFTDQISQLMDSADLLLTKPGGLSTSEAMIKGLPMVLIDAVAGCEEYNLSYFTRIGGARTADTVRELALICVQLLNDPPARQAMTRALKGACPGNAAQNVCALIQEENQQTKK